MRNDGVRTVRTLGESARRAKEALKYSKKKVYQGEPTSGMVLNSTS
jgi:hypothetical protein